MLNGFSNYQFQIGQGMRVNTIYISKKYQGTFNETLDSSLILQTALPSHAAGFQLLLGQIQRDKSNLLIYKYHALQNMRYLEGTIFLARVMNGIC